MPDQIPMSRYLPQVPYGVVKDWAEKQVNKGEWILDPFGTDPRIPVELARSGYRVLVAANNPTIRFLIELLSEPPTELQFQSALARISSEIKGSERIQDYINSLYLTNCVQCGKQIPVEAFIWERDSRAPSGKIYSCQYCYESGTFATSEIDKERASRFEKDGLHKARAGERIAPLDDPDRIHVNRALAVYLPRSIYAIFTLLNKYDQIPHEFCKPLSALLLATFDQGTNLWPHPYENIRPKILTTYSQYLEKNIWKEMEKAVTHWNSSLQLWRYSQNFPPVTKFPELSPASGGITIFEGRIHELSQRFTDAPERISVSAVVSALPRPNQAFWSLSVIWSGWLWGQKSSSKIKAQLRRKRYDWFWHNSALSKSFIDLKKLLSPPTPVFGLISSSETSFLGSVLTPAWLAGYSLVNMSQRIDSGQVQILWELGDISTKSKLPKISSSKFSNSFTKFIKQYLLENLEPVRYFTVYSAGFFRVMSENIPDDALLDSHPGDVYNLLIDAIHETLGNEENFHRFGKSEVSLENARFWLEQKKYHNKFRKGQYLSISDQIELKILTILRDNQQILFSQLDKLICEMYPGLFTPNQDLVIKCLESYAEQLAEYPGKWAIREQDNLQNRIDDLNHISKQLIDIGERIQLESKQVKEIIFLKPISEIPDEPQQINWVDADGVPRYVFYIITTGIYNQVALPFLSNSVEKLPVFSHPLKKVIVLPGGRAGLVGFKLQQDFLFSESISREWTFLKFRHVRRLAEDHFLTPEKFSNNITLDPLANTDPQMTFL